MKNFFLGIAVALLVVMTFWGELGQAIIAWSLSKSAGLTERIRTEAELPKSMDVPVCRDGWYTILVPYEYTLEHYDAPVLLTVEFWDTAEDAWIRNPPYNRLPASIDVSAWRFCASVPTTGILRWS